MDSSYKQCNTPGLSNSFDILYSAELYAASTHNGPCVCECVHVREREGGSLVCFYVFRIRTTVCQVLHDSMQ